MSAGTSRRPGWAQRLLLALLALYFVLPLVAMARFAFQRIPVVSLSRSNLFEGWSVADLAGVVTDPRTLEMTRRSVTLAALSIGLTLLLLVPVATFVEVRAPRLRTAVVVLSLTPWVVPPIALVVGVASTFRQTAPWFLASPYSLVPFYALWALPFSYRALDAGLRSLDARTLYEAARSLGASWPTFFFRVIVPNLRSSLLVVATLTAATVLGEFAFAALLLKETLPTHLVVLQGSDPRAGLALALVVMIGTAIIISAAVTVLRRRGQSFNASGI